MVERRHIDREFWRLVAGLRNDVQHAPPAAVRIPARGVAAAELLLAAVATGVMLRHPTPWWVSSAWVAVAVPLLIVSTLALLDRRARRRLIVHEWMSAGLPTA